MNKGDAKIMTAAAPPSREKVKFTAQERSAVSVLAGIYSTRMLGLFLLMPVLSLYASRLPGSTPRMVGLAMGAYAMVQTVFQIPFGRWSDRYGRRPVILLGLLLFLVGSIVGAFSTSLAGVIAARAIQGAGAVSAAVTALLADHTRDAIRTRAMAFIGIGIGASFVISLVAAPALDVAIGVRGIFWLMGLMAMVGMALLHWGVPVHPVHHDPKPQPRTALLRVARLPQLRSHFVGVFALSFILGSTFLAVPQLLVHVLNIAEARLWQVYLGVFVVSVLGTYALIRAAERAHRPGSITLLAVGIATAVQALFGLLNSQLWTMLLLFTVFFAMFNFLEARLPAALSKAAPAADRGAALGIFATLQAFGNASGPILGGQIAARFGYGGVFWLSAAVGLLWAIVVVTGSNES